MQDSRPPPDPTILTTQQLLREILILKELLEARFAGCDKTIDRLQREADSRLVFIHEQVAQLQSLHEEKFRSVGIQFVERDTRTEQTSRDSKVAVDAALQAAKEAVGEQNRSSFLAITKSEAATTKQIDQISVIIATMANGLNDKIDDIKMRLTSIEGRSKGLGDGWGILVGAVGIIIAAIAVAVNLTNRRG